MRRLTILVVPPLLLLALAACGDPAAGPGVASADGATPTASASPTTQGDPVKFVDCMREHGIDAKVAADGKGIGIRGKPGDEGKMDEAQRACRKYAPSGGDGKGKPMSKADQEKFLKFAQCMRDHGVKDFPDPANGEPLVDTTKIPSLGDRSPRTDPVFAPAMDKCRVALEAALRDRG